ncbi:fibronectin type III domain-containing protein [Flavobacteriaceae bacterium M23B6Z8]
MKLFFTTYRCIKLSLLLLGLMLTIPMNSQDLIGEVKVLARATSNKVLLRWAVDNPLGWKKANEYGFIIERITVSRNGNAVIPLETEVLTSFPLRPAPLEEWQDIAMRDDNAAVIAQALYGEDFEVAAATGMSNVLAMNAELEQRFTFAMLAAEQSFEAAKLAAWGFEDTNVNKGEKYFYKIKVNLPADTKFSINNGSVYASTDFFEALPKPVGFVSLFADKNVMLNWNYSILQYVYSSYLIEKSDDGVNFSQVNGQPVFNAEEGKEDAQISMFFNDSITNNRTYYYRIKGVTSFGETGPPSQIEKGQGKDILDYTPHITRKLLPDAESVELFWEFAEEGNAYISGFSLKKANKAEGPYQTVLQDIPLTARKVTYKGVGRTNYFSIVAIGKNGTEKPSFPALVQPVDSIPPAPPVGLTGTIDTTGLVRLSWEANKEPDLSGYRIFRGNNPEEEFSQITKRPQRNNTFTDTIAVKNLNKNIYYRVIAVDQRYNQSELSKILTIEKPDVTPPSPPVISTYELTEKGIILKWIPSSSEDVASHAIYRKSLQEKEALWEKITTLEIDKKNEFQDEDIMAGRRYAYTLVAIDKTGWESKPSTQLVVTAPKELYGDKIIRFNATADRDNRVIRLSWKTRDANEAEFLLYRSEGEAPLTLYKTLEKDTQVYNDVDLIINTKYTYGIQLIEKDGTQSALKKVKLTY